MEVILEKCAIVYSTSDWNDMDVTLHHIISVRECLEKHLVPVKIGVRQFFFPSSDVMVNKKELVIKHWDLVSFSFLAPSPWLTFLFLATIMGVSLW